jgi:protein subunit release factor A
MGRRERIVNQSDLKINVFGNIKSGMHKAENNCRFVKIEHVPSGIVVTKYGRFQINAKNEAMEEIENLIALWEMS